MQCTCTLLALILGRNRAWGPVQHCKQSRGYVLATGVGSFYFIVTEGMGWTVAAASTLHVRVNP
jgi:hypothetical protein